MKQKLSKVGPRAEPEPILQVASKPQSWRTASPRQSWTGIYPQESSLGTPTPTPAKDQGKQKGTLNASMNRETGDRWGAAWRGGVGCAYVCVCLPVCLRVCQPQGSFTRLSVKFRGGRKVLVIELPQQATGNGSVSSTGLYGATGAQDQGWGERQGRGAPCEAIASWGLYKQEAFQAASVAQVPMAKSPPL